MTDKEKQYIDELIEKFNNMTYEEQQEELRGLYTTTEIAYVEVVERYANAIRRLREIQKQLKDIEYK